MKIKKYMRKIGKGVAYFAVVTALAVTPIAASAQGKAWPTKLTNIAAQSSGGRIIGATSILDNDDKFSANNLIDGQVYSAENKTGTLGWCSNKFDPVNMDTVTLGFKDNATHLIGKIVLNPSAAVVPSRWAKDVEVQVSTDKADGPYRTVSILTLQRKATNQSFTILPVHARFVRLVMRSNWGSDRGTALGEVEIYEAISQDNPTGQLIARLEQTIHELKDYRDTQVQMGNGSGQRIGELSPSAFQLVQLVAPDQQKFFPVSDNNIAAKKNGGKIMNYSSIYNKDSKYTAENLIDGETYNLEKKEGSLGWSSEGFKPGEQYVTIGFGDDRTHLIGKLVLNPTSDQSRLRWARRVDVQVTSGSAKDGPWRSAGVINLRTDPVNQEFLIRPVEAKYVRLVFMANGPGDLNLPGLEPGVNSDRSVSLGEVEIYEATASSEILDSLIGRFDQILIDLKRLHDSDDLKTSADKSSTKAARQALLFGKK